MKKELVSIAAMAIISSAYAAHASADTHVVQKGDTLWQLSKKYSVSVAELKSMNGLSSDMLKINQSIKIVKNSSAPAPKPAPPAVKEPSKPAQPAARTYTVASGDTLSKIALKHNISLQTLMSLNDLTTHLIFPGQTLKITSSTAQGPQEEVKPVTPPPAVPAPSLTQYTVKSGDTLSKIAVQTKTSVSDLKKWNGLSGDFIFVGQVLFLQNNNAAPDQPAVNVPNNVQEIISAAKNLMGTPYVWGGSTLSGFDCSGFIYYVLKQTGSQMGRYSTDGYYSRSYYVSTPQPGDIVFFENTYRKGISHMGIYLGNNEFIHADSTAGVTISNLNNSYFKKHFDGFKRFY